jgi:DNA-binding GntR family transcriptional regulator
MVKIKKYVEFNKVQNINKNSGIPYYYQLKEYIKKQIESGNWKLNEQILSERFSK